MEIEEYLTKKQKLPEETGVIHPLVPTAPLLLLLLAFGIGYATALPREVKQEFLRQSFSSWQSAFFIILPLLCILYITFATHFALFRYFSEKQKLQERFERHLRSRAERRANDPSMEKRISALAANIEESQRVLDDLADEMSLRKELLEKLANEAEEKRGLAMMSKEASDAVDARIADHFNAATAELIRFQKGESRKSIFVSGILVAFAVGFLTNSVFELAKVAFGW